MTSAGTSAWVLVVLVAEVLCAVTWLGTIVRWRMPRPSLDRDPRESVRLGAAALAITVLLVGSVLTDFPLTSGASFWAEHALLTGVLTTCALLGVGYVFVDRQEKLQARERQVELERQAATILEEMTRTVTSDIFLATRAFSDHAAATSLERARAHVELQREVVADALVGARTWFVALSGRHSLAVTPALSMLADYMGRLRAAEYEIRVFQLKASAATSMTSGLRNACTEMDKSLDLAHSVVRRYLQEAGLDFETVVIEDFARRNATP